MQKHFRVVEIRDCPKLSGQAVELLKEEWPDKSEAFRMKAMQRYVRSDGVASFTLLLVNDSPMNEEVKREPEGSDDGLPVVLGHCRLDASKYSFKNSKTILLHSLCVKKQLRNQGIGRLLMQAAARYASNHGYVHTLLRTSKRNAGFYMKCGFEMLQEDSPFEKEVNPAEAPGVSKSDTKDIHGELLKSIKKGALLKKVSGSKKLGVKAPINENTQTQTNEQKESVAEVVSIWMAIQNKIENPKAAKRRRNRKKKKNGKLNNFPASVPKEPSEQLKAAAAEFKGINLAEQVLEDLGETTVHGHVYRMGQLFFRVHNERHVGLGPVKVKKGDRLLFVKTFKRSASDQAEWPNGLHCLKCPFTLQSATDTNNANDFNYGYMALHQIINRTAGNRKQLAVRVLPVLIHPKVYGIIYHHVPGGHLLPRPLTSINVRSLKSYSETWNNHLEFRQYVTEDFVENYSKRMSKGRSCQTFKDKRGNVLGAVFRDKEEKSEGEHGPSQT